MQKVKINISGSEYTINTNRDPNYVKDIVREINKKISAHMKNNSALTVNHTLILLILECMDDYQELKKSEDNLREQLNQYISDFMKAERENNILKQKLNKTKEIEKNEE